MSKTPELEYFARMTRRGIVMRASNGLPFSLNLHETNIVHICIRSMCGHTCAKCILQESFNGGDLAHTNLRTQTHSLDGLHRVVAGTKHLHVLQVHAIALRSLGQLQRKGVHDEGLNGRHLRVRRIECADYHNVDFDVRNNNTHTQVVEITVAASRAIIRVKDANACRCLVTLL